MGPLRAGQAAGLALLPPGQPVRLALLHSLPSFPLPPLPYPALVSAVQEPGASPLLVASTCLARLLILLEQFGPLSPQLEAALPPIICLARLPQFSLLAPAPPLAFSLGWQPNITTTVRPP